MGRDLRQTVNCYWFLRQTKNAIQRDKPHCKLTPFRVDWLSRRISGIGRAIMEVRGLEISAKEAA